MTDVLTLDVTGSVSAEQMHKNSNWILTPETRAEELSIHDVLAAKQKGGPVRGRMRRVSAAAVERGGRGSGHFGREGRPGKVGGSSPDGGGSSARPRPDAQSKPAADSTPESAAAEADAADSKKQEGEQTDVELAQSAVRNFQFGDEDPYLAAARQIYAEQPPEVMARVEEVRQKIKDGQTTQSMYKDPDTGEYTPERAALHEKIIEQVMGQAQPTDNPEFIMTGGYPGSGKSSLFQLLEQQGEDFSNYVHIDSDAIKGTLPEYEGWNAALTHQEASDIVDEIVSRGVSGRYNVIYDATMKTRSNAEAIVNAFENQDYSSRVMFVDVPIEEAMRRAMHRFASRPNGRFVDLNYIATHDNKNIQSLEAVKGVADRWEHWNNDVPFGEPPILVGKGTREGEGEQ